MSTNYTAHTVIGVKLDANDLFTDIKARGCKHKETSNKHCSECGKLMWTIKSVCRDANFEDGSCKVFGMSCIKKSSDDNIIYVGMTYSADDYNKDSEHYAEIPNVHVMMQLAEDIRNKLEPLGIWNKSKFGMWTVLSCSY